MPHPSESNGRLTGKAGDLNETQVAAQLRVPAAETAIMMIESDPEMIMITVGCRMPQADGLLLVT